MGIKLASLNGVMMIAVIAVCGLVIAGQFGIGGLTPFFGSTVTVTNPYQGMSNICGNGVCDTSVGETPTLCFADCGTAGSCGTPQTVTGVSAFLYDKALPQNKITDAGVYLDVYPSGVIATSTTPKEDSIVNSAGKFALVGGTIQTCSPYSFRFKDTTSNTYYCEYYNPTVDPKVPDITTVTMTQHFLMSKVGTFKNLYSGAWTKQSRTALSAAFENDAGSGALNINATASTESAIGIECPIQIGNSVSSSYLNNVVLQVYKRSANQMPIDAITSATIEHYTGTTLIGVSDILAQVQSYEPITVNGGQPITSAMSESAYLQLTLTNSSLTSGDILDIYIDDLGAVNAVDQCSQSGATGSHITVTVNASG